MIFALVGNQNSGKTTLFNQLTGSNQHVGNFPGVTVERKDGRIKGYQDITVVDLPGIYSLSPYTKEEIVTRDFLISNKPDCIINIVDATNIERNLYLSLQLIDLNIPMVIALNMMDEVKANGITIHIKRLKEKIGLPIVPISASKNEGINELVDVAINIGSKKQRPQKKDFCSGAIHRAIHATAILIEDHAQDIGIEARFAATKLIEGDMPMLTALKLSDNEQDMLKHTVEEMEREVSTDREAALADMRYNFIESICKQAVIKSGLTREHSRSIKIDNILTHKYLGIPVFLSVMMIIFWLTFGVIGNALSNVLSILIDYIIKMTERELTSYGLNPVINSLIVDGVLSGIGSVLSFLPIIAVLFLFLSILEDSGYMARVAFIMDKSLRKIGLSGKSFVPMLMGFGCTVPAVMATRTLASERDRKMTILLTPFMSCSAKLPIYAIFTVTFFAEYQALIMMGLYLTGIIMGIITGAILNRTLFKGKPIPFVMELPNYRLPSAKTVGLMIWDKAKGFIERAFTVIFIATLVIWFLQRFDAQVNVVENSSESMLACIGKVISPMFKPLGFADWKASTALMAGFTAKEAVVSTFAVLTGASISELPEALKEIFNPINSISFLVFTLLYTPCVAAIGTIKNELQSRFSAFLIVLYQTAIAWLSALVVYNILNLFVSI